MRAIDVGHDYELAVYDGDGTQQLRFMKREGDGYPFNVGHHPGTNCQEVIRALIDRVKYLDRQIACPENPAIIGHLRECIRLFEERAARRHGTVLPALPIEIELIPTDSRNGHLRTHPHA